MYIGKQRSKRDIVKECNRTIKYDVGCNHEQ